MTDTAASAARPTSTDIATRLIDRRSSVESIAVSPSGDSVAYVVATALVDTNTTQTRIWLGDTPLTAGEHDGQPTWSPDGRFLAFTSRRAEKKTESTLHVLPIAQPGEVRTLCTMPDGLDDVAWSPDGSTIAFTSRTQHERYTKADSTWQSPRKVERFFGRFNGEDWIFDRPNHVHVVAADGTGAVRNLTPGEFQHSGVSWLSDSSGIITAAQRHDSWDTDFAEDLYLVPIDADDDPDGIRCLTAHDADYSMPAVSPDGTRVAFVAREDLRLFPQNARVGVLDIADDTSTTNVITDVAWASADFDRSFSSTAGTRPPVWLDDHTVLAVAEDRGEAHLMSMSADGSTTPKALTSGPLSVTDFDAVGDTIATARATIERPAELFIGDERITSVTSGIAAITRSWEKFTVPTTDGSDEIDCWLMRPVDFDESATYPVLLNVHGGPFSQYGEYFFDEAQMQAAAGFVVVLGNPRGSSGRHTGWGQAVLGPKHPVRSGTGWGQDDVADVLATIDGALDRYPFCDRDRVGMLGGSYGGFMATWLACHHGERFRAICSERAVNNLLSLEWSSDIATAFRTEHGPDHITDPAAYSDYSPIRHVDKIDTPMLLIHSEEDWRCPIIQAEELWVAMKLLGKEVDFYRFPGENHELSRSGSPIHRVQRAEIILDWFADKLAPQV